MIMYLKPVVLIIQMLKKFVRWIFPALQCAIYLSELHKLFRLMLSFIPLLILSYMLHFLIFITSFWINVLEIWHVSCSYNMIFLKKLYLDPYILFMYKKSLIESSFIVLYNKYNSPPGWLIVILLLG
jgi:hypothetical protein